MAQSQVGIKTSGQVLKHMLEKTGYSVKKLDGMDKLDLLELIRDQLQTSLESRRRTQLKLEELISFLRYERMELEAMHARDAILTLEKLRMRERERLGKHLAPQTFEVYEDALALIPDSEVHDVFAATPAGVGQPVDTLEEGKKSDELATIAKSDEQMNENGRKRKGHCLQSTEALSLIPGFEVHDAFGTRPATVAYPRELNGEAKSADALAVIAASDEPAHDDRIKTPMKRPRLQSMDEVGEKDEQETQKQPPRESDETAKKAPEQAREERILALLDRDAIHDYLPQLPPAREDAKDDLTRIRGIGYWIQARLNRIQIYSIAQIASFTSEIRDAVAKAIRYFPGRIETDLWVYQADKITSGKEWIVKPSIPRSGTSSVIMIDKEKYDRELIDIARHYGKNGSELSDEHAECLWFSAMDGRKITALEKKTLRYILGSFNIKPSATARLQ